MVGIDDVFCVPFYMQMWSSSGRCEEYRPCTQPKHFNMKDIMKAFNGVCHQTNIDIICQQESPVEYLFLIMFSNKFLFSRYCASLL